MKTLKMATTTLFSLLLALPVFAGEAVWIDVRTPAEYEAEHLQDTTLIPHGEIGDKIGKLNLDKSAAIKLFCRSGKRAGIAKQTLESLGYTNVENMGSVADARKAHHEDEGHHHH